MVNIDTLSNNRILNILIPLVLLITGIYCVPITLFDFDFSKIPGDLGDARFNNYILEHGYLYFTGHIDKYWDGQFMYPYKNVIALSDNLLGTVPIYSVFRLLEIDRETSFQFWFITIFALNYICCFWALKKWSDNTILSAVGAYIYAFGLYNHGQIFHAQVFPRFIAPLIFYWTWKFIKEKDSKFLFLSLVGLIYQFYCGVYLGFLLIYVLVFFIIAYLIIYRDVDLLKQYTNKNTLFKHLGIVIFTILIFLPLILPYYEISKITGVRTFDAAFNSLPRLQSYFFTSPASVVWDFLYPITAFSFPEWWNHFLFSGIISWLGIACIPYALFSKNTTQVQKKFITFLSLGFFLSIIFCLNINGFTLYKVIYQIPGFSSMRSLDRIINTQVIFMILLFVFVLKSLSTSISKFNYILLSLPILVIVDNLIIPEPHKSFYKKDAQNEVNFIKENIKETYNVGFEAIAYIPIDMLLVKSDQRNNMAISQTISTMIACQDLKLKCVNGYSGFNPGNFEDFFLKPGYSTLKNWCEFNHWDINTIQIINETPHSVKEYQSIQIQTKDNKFLCADEVLNNHIAANRDQASTWETFNMVKLSNNKVVFQSHTTKYFSLLNNQSSSIAATSSKISFNEIFTMQTESDDLVYLIGPNGKYVSVNKENKLLMANGSNMQEAEPFVIHYIDASNK